MLHSLEASIESKVTPESLYVSILEPCMLVSQNPELLDAMTTCIDYGYSHILQGGIFGMQSIYKQFHFNNNMDPYIEFAPTSVDWPFSYLMPRMKVILLGLRLIT